MDNIKFRGYNQELDKWIYGTYMDGFIIDGVIESSEDYIAIERWNPVVIQSVGQYTRFKDQDGLDVYGGDIFIDSAQNKWLVQFGLHTITTYLGGMQRLKTSHVGWYLQNNKGETASAIEIDYIDKIGNLYEDKDLLDQEGFFD